MNKCEHGKPITKFCMFQHCQSKQTAGCEDCIRKYHNHIGQISFLTEDDIKSLVKKFHVEANYRPKSRSLQECIFNFFTHIKTNISHNLDIACKNFINEIGYPYLQKNGALGCYKRLKNKQYRKVTQKQLKELWQVYKVVDYNDVIKEEKMIYKQSVIKMEEMIDKLEKNFKEMFQNLTETVSASKSTTALYDRSYFLKINDVFKQIKKYPEINFPQNQPAKQQKKQIQKELQSPQKPKKLQRDARDVSLDKHVKIQNRLKTQPVAKQEENIVSLKYQQKAKNDSQHTQKEKQKQKARKAPKYSFEMRPQQLTIKPQVKIQSGLDYSQKQQEINERKKKLMQLMNAKSVKRQQIPNNKNMTLTPVRQKPQTNTFGIGNYIKQSLTSDRNILGKDYSTPSNVAKYSKQDYSFKSSQKQPASSQRSKTACQQEEQLNQQQKKQPQQETVMSNSETETESLFNAKINIPIDDSKPQEDFQIKQQSVQKCFIVPEVDIIAREIIDMVSECQSPLLMKKKQIQIFSAFMKLAESKIIEESEIVEPNQDILATTKEEEKSFVKLKKVLEDSDMKPQVLYPQKQANQLLQVPTQSSPKLQPVKKQQDSVQITDNQQMSLALLLKSLKLPSTQAIPYLQKSIQHSSNNLSAAQYLSYLYLQTQKPQQCLKLCNDILKLISSSQSNLLALRLNINKSAALNYLGRYSQCITFLQRCLKYRHNDILYKNLADAYYSIGILQKAIYNYQHAIIQNSSNTQAHYNLAVCHYQQENYYNASIYIDKALKHQPNNSVYLEMKKYNDQKILNNPL